MIKKLIKASILGLLLSLYLSSISTAAEITKAQRDDRDYRVITLANKLQAVLVSDKTLKQTGVSLNLSVGYHSDPTDRPGLFHFTEHMLFLGTEKYPSSQAYGDYITANGGSYNAYTSTENSNYYFSVNSESIEGALDRFSQFFIDPLFDETYVKRELHAVESEHAKNAISEANRILQVQKTTTDPRHPFNRFGTGNLETLSNNGAGKLIVLLRENFEKYYSSNVMNIGIVSNHSLDQLEQMIKKYFSAIKNKNVIVPKNNHSPYSPQFLKKRLEIKSLKKLQRLRVFFPIPNQRSNYKEKPASYISRLLGYEGKNSLLSLLKSKNWANSLYAGGSESGSDFDTFCIVIALTSNGLNHQDEIIEHIFQYIHLINKDGLKKFYFDEEQKLARIRFEYVTKTGPVNYANLLANRLQKYPEEDLLNLTLLKKWDQVKIKNLLKMLIPDKMRIELVSHSVKTNLVEKWYGTKYGIEQIPEEKIKKWKSVSLHPTMSLPKPNPFISKTITLKPVEKDLNHPEVIVNKPALKVWHKQDNQFESPKVDVCFKLFSPFASKSPRTILMTNIYTSLLMDSLNAYSYPAQEAGLKYSIKGNRTGLEIVISGYSEKLPILLATIVKNMKSLKIDPQRFETAVAKMKQSLNNHNLMESRSLTGYEFGYIMTQDAWHINDLTKVIDTIHHRDVQAFIPTLLSRLSSHGLIYGNIIKAEAMEIVRFFEDALIENTDLAALDNENHTIQLGNQKHWIYQQQVKDINSSIVSYYQYGPESMHMSAVQSLMGRIISQPFYNQLRTKEQLGYVVYATDLNLNRVNGFRFVVQSSIKDPVFLEERVEHFLKSYQAEFADMSNERFEKYKNGLLRKLRVSAKNIQEEFYRYWSQISNHRYEFDWEDKFANALEKITKEDVTKYYNNLFIKSPKQLTIQSFGSKHPLRKISKGKLINNPSSFKRGIPYYGTTTTNMRKSG
jgi:insulysin